MCVCVCVWGGLVCVCVCVGRLSVCACVGGNFSILYLRVSFSSSLADHMLLV